MIRRLLLTLLLLPLAGAAASATSLPPVGQRAEGTIDLLGKPLPLPPGEWRVAAAGFGQAEGDDPGPYGTIGGVLMLRSDGRDTGEFLLLHTNALPVRAGWGQPPECAAAGALFQSIGEPRNLHNACSYVVALRRSQILRSRLPGLGTPEESARFAFALPPWALVSGFRVSDRRDMLDVRYGIAPGQPDPATWFTVNPAPDHAHRIVVQELGEWVQTARASALAALRDPVGQVPALPMMVLDRSRGNAAVPQEQISALRLGLYKLATYRVPSTVFNLAVASIVVGNVYTGAWISFWQMLTHSAVYLGNELAWEWPSPTPVTPLVGTPPVTMGGSAQLRPVPEPEPPIRLAVNSNELPAGAVPLRNVYPINGKQMPLPAGRWTVLASAVREGITNVILGQLEDEMLQGLIVVYSNIEKTPAILGPSAECGRRDIVFAITRYDTPEDGFCAYAKRVIPMAPDERAMHDNPLWAKVAQSLADDGILVPSHLLMVGARARTRDNFIDTHYYFAPRAGAAAEAAAVLPDWVDLLQGSLELGVRGRLGADTPAAPWPWDHRAMQVARLAQARGPLEELAASGAISPDVLGRQIAAADALIADREQQRLSLWSRSFLKVATYRVAAYVDTFAVQTFFTASPAQGLAVASIHAVAKPVIAYGNEIYWARSGMGKAPAALLSANFPEIGSDQ